MPGSFVTQKRMPGQDGTTTFSHEAPIDDFSSQLQKLQ